ncbi:hypothetical protein ACH4GP_03710 [Streptomyces celluloflavus]|uniref:Integral membrane protein n=1 Tax=Streptomyces celluloflavus TaxID=58344 RepID=A0ABW7R609_9ACTN
MGTSSTNRTSGTSTTTDERTGDEAAPVRAATGDTGGKGDTGPETAAAAAETTAESKESAEAKEGAGAEATGKTAPAADKDAAAADAAVAEDGSDDPEDLDDLDEDAVPERAATGVAAGAGAVVAAGLGLASVTGTWLGTLLAERQTLVGQIKLQSGKATDQIATVYGTPWHTTALVNGVFALLAVLVAAVALTNPRATWVRAVAWGGLALGVLGLLISVGMYFDLFATLPSIPKGAGAGS